MFPYPVLRKAGNLKIIESREKLGKRKINSVTRSKFESQMGSSWKCGIIPTGMG